MIPSFSGDKGSRYTELENELITTLNPPLNLSKNKNFNLFVIGHSCSISDSQMLHRIFKDDSLNRVKLIYYKSVDNYKKQRFNIDKIMTNTGHNIDGKISGVNALTKLPQFDDNETTKSLNNSKIDEMLNSDSLRNNIGEYHIY